MLLRVRAAEITARIDYAAHSIEPSRANRPRSRGRNSNNRQMAPKAAYGVFAIENL
jgi:hypothetical protein